MKAIILAAGKGTRLRPITETTPKPLIPILCKPLIEWHLDALMSIDEIDEILIVTSYMEHKIRRYIDNLKLKKPVRFVHQDKELGTGDAVLKAIEFVDDDDETLIIYGDVFLRGWGLYKKLARYEGNYITAVPVDNPKEYGVIVTDGDKFIGVIEKPTTPPSNIINAGIYKFKAKHIKEHTSLEFSPRGELEFTDIVAKIAKTNLIKVYRLPHSSWIDIGRPWNVIDANKMALQDIQSDIKGVIEPNTYIKGPVYVSEKTIIKSGTYVEGPVFIDQEAEIGPNARIRPNTVICRGARIGFCVEVKESIIFEHAHISHLSYVGDSIICEHVNFGAGTVTANLRFDEKPVKMFIKGQLVSTGRRKFGAVVGAYVKTGINVSIMPGVKIGSYSWISPGAVVTRDVPPRSFYKWKGTEYIEDLNLDIKW